MTRQRPQTPNSHETRHPERAELHSLKTDTARVPPTLPLSLTLSLTSSTARRKAQHSAHVSTCLHAVLARKQSRRCVRLISEAFASFVWLRIELNFVGRTLFSGCQRARRGLHDLPRSVSGVSQLGLLHVLWWLLVGPKIGERYKREFYCLLAHWMVTPVLENPCVIAMSISMVTSVSGEVAHYVCRHGPVVPKTHTPPVFTCKQGFSTEADDFKVAELDFPARVWNAGKPTRPSLNDGISRATGLMIVGKHASVCEYGEDCPSTPRGSGQ